MEILWFAMLAFSSLFYAARPQGFLLALSWFCTYIMVLSFESHNAVAIFDFWFVLLSIPMALFWSNGRWVWLIVAGHIAYLVGFAVQWFVWQTNSVWLGEPFYFFTRVVFTLQCSVLLIPAYKDLKRQQRRRLKNQRGAV